MSDDLELGRCCGCRCLEGVSNLVLLNYKAPLPPADDPAESRGWGCVLCGLEDAGAIAVLCDRCAAAAWIESVCVGYPGLDMRAAVASFPHVPHDHDAAKHPELHLAR